jgi:hypothetical protein
MDAIPLSCTKGKYATMLKDDMANKAINLDNLENVPNTPALTRRIKSKVKRCVMGVMYQNNARTVRNYLAYVCTFTSRASLFTA